MKYNSMQDSFYSHSFGNFKIVRHAPIRKPNYESKNTYFRKVGIFDDKDIFDKYILPTICDKNTTWESFKSNGGARVYGNGFGSKYWYTPEGVYRESDHWGKVASCFWYIDAKELTLKGISNTDTKFSKPIIGFAKWSDFKEYSIVTHKIRDVRDEDLEGFYEEYREEYRQSCDAMPTLNDGVYLAYEFNDFQICEINKESIRLDQPLPFHPNHRNMEVEVIHGLDFLIDDYIK